MLNFFGNLPSYLLIFAAIGLSAAMARQHSVSPDHRFEAYTVPNNEDGTGMKLFLRAAGSRDAGALLRENDRWIETSWSPDSRFLAVTDGSDGHVTDVFVYRVVTSKAVQTAALYESYPSGGAIADYARAPGIVAQLCYHTPDLWTYDVQWAVRGWDAPRHTILLTRRSRAPRPTRLKIVLDLAKPRQ